LFWILVQSIILHRFDITWQISIIDALTTSTTLAVACLISLNIFKFYQPGASNRSYRGLITIGIAILQTILFKVFILNLVNDNLQYIEFINKSIPIRFIISLLVLTFLTVTNWLLYSINEQSEKVQQLNSVKHSVKEVELATIKQQLQPHFLSTV
jgi:two-component system LytT family sensor kinase